MVRHTRSFDKVFDADYRLIGLMGMGFQSISEYNAPPVVQTLVKTGKTTVPVFAFKLSDSGAELTIGGTNNALYTGGFTAVPVTQEGYVFTAVLALRFTHPMSDRYWQVDLDAVLVGTTKALGTTSAIIDRLVSFYPSPSYAL
jgi:cathepsin D